MTLSARFWAKVEKTDTCWNWTACVNSRGYGCVGINGKRYLTHRVSYEAAVGPIPEGLTIDHLCRNKRCVRPDHLEPVTMRENIQRAARLITHCTQGHPLPEPNERGRRICANCRSRWERRNYSGNLADVTDLRHGTLTAYNYYGCRCDDCKANRSEYQRAYAKRREDAA